ncbi:MAG TPA: HAD family phosphatase [Terriglobia bacterium]|nr:HAD family phosphatase [Terriglobia bacterium]
MADRSASKSSESKHERVDHARIRSVVFDYGNVVCLPQRVSEIERMASACGLPLDRFHEQYWRFRRSYDRGELSGEAYWASVTDGQGQALTHEQLSRVLALDGESWAHPNASTLEWAKRLKRENFGVAILSNMPQAVSDYLTANCGWLALFDRRVYSYAVGCAKPEPGIYEYCLQTLKVAAGEILFLDDRPENVNAAWKLGIHSLLFDTVEHTSVRAANEFGLPVP